MIITLYEHEFTCDNQVLLAQVIVKLYEHEFTCDIHSCSSDNETEKTLDTPSVTCSSNLKMLLLYGVLGI